MSVPTSLVNKVRRYYDLNKARADRGYGENWLRVLIAFGVETHPTLQPYTAEEARASEKIWRGWRPVRQALEALESDTPLPSEPDHSLRPGSPEWRRAQYNDVDLASLPEWTNADATAYFRGKGFVRFSAPASVRGVLVWLDFFQDDQKIWRQAVGGSKLLARFRKG